MRCHQCKREYHLDGGSLCLEATTAAVHYVPLCGKPCAALFCLKLQFIAQDFRPEDPPLVLRIGRHHEGPAYWISSAARAVAPPDTPLRASTLSELIRRISRDTLSRSNVQTRSST